ncbi:retrovirus-related pol polyprotein from transposon TNT 1-94 [Tanacetum coccineum]
MSTKVPTEDMIELENLFGPLFDEYLNEENQVVLKSSAVTTADASDKRQQQPDSTSSASTLATTISTDGHFDVVVSLSCSGNVTASTAATTLSRRYKMKYLSESYEVPDTEDTIRFKLDTQDIMYAVDMFRDTIQPPVETPDNPFVAPVNIEIIESFMHTVGYQGVVDKAEPRHKDILAHLLHASKIVAEKEGIVDGFRVVINSGATTFAVNGRDGVKR